MAVDHTGIAPSSGRMLAAILPPHPRASSCRQVHLLPRGWRAGVPPTRADVHTPSILWAKRSMGCWFCCRLFAVSSSLEFMLPCISKLLLSTVIDYITHIRHNSKLSFTHSCCLKSKPLIIFYILLFPYIISCARRPPRN